MGKGFANKKWIGIVAAVVVILATITAVLLLRGHKKGEAEAGVYVEKISQLMGGVSGDTKFAGIVDTQDAWSVQNNQENPVKEILVTAGQEVKTGTPILQYDSEKYRDELAQANIDLERTKNELSNAKDTISQLTKEKKNAPSAEQANYTIQIQQQQLEVKQKELEVQSKQMSIDQLNDNLKNATLTSPIDGIVKTVADLSKLNQNQEDYRGYSDGSESALVTIVKTGELRIKGSVNEQNIHLLSEGMKVTVHARNSDQTWSGEISQIDRDSKAKNNDNRYGMMSMGDEENKSSNYPFYVALENSEGLMIGQHVFISKALGGMEERDGIWLDEYYVDVQDEENPFVWKKDGKNRLTKQSVIIGERDEETGKLEIKDGLTMEDSIAIPDESLREGMKVQAGLTPAASEEE